MPNVAGVQFPYTPQGEQAAQLYQRSLSPRRGLGFRPIGMQEGSTPEHENAMLYIKWAHGEGSDSLPPQFQMNATSVAELLVIMRDDPEAAVEYANRLKGAIGVEDVVGRGYGDPTISNEDFYPPLGEMEQYQGHPRELGRVGRGYGDPRISNQALRAAGDTRPSDQDSSLGPVFHGGFTPPEKEYFERAFDANQARQQGLMGTPPGAPPAQFAGPYLGVPQGMAHGGVPRGTVAGELEPRGYLTARQAGETMRERAKGLRDRRNYGGGIGSLYNRYG